MRAHLRFFCFMSDVGKEECSKLRKLVIFGILSRLGHFPQVFGQVKDWLVLQFNEMIKVPNAVAFPMDFALLSRGQQRGVLKRMKNDYFLVFSTIRVIFPCFWVCKAMAYTLELHEMIRVQS